MERNELGRWKDLAESFQQEMNKAQGRPDDEVTKAWAEKHHLSYPEILINHEGDHMLLWFHEAEGNFGIGFFGWDAETVVIFEEVLKMAEG